MAALGVKVIEGSHSDLKLITEQAAKSDIIVNCADADDLELTKAILAGAKSTTINAKRPILIHTSGTGLVVGESNGAFDSDAKTYNVRIPLARLFGAKRPRTMIPRTFEAFPQMLPIVMSTSSE